MSPDHLRELADRLAQGDQLDRCASNALRHYLKRAPEGVTLDEAFGFAIPQGGTPWWRSEVLQCRDDAILNLASEYFGELNLSAQAAEIQKQTRRYRDGRWVHDRDRDQMPRKYRGTPTEHMWNIFQACDGKIPDTPQRFKQILDKGEGRNESDDFISLDRVSNSN